MKHKIFISLTHRDTKIAEALSTAIKKIFGELFEINYSTSKELDGGIRGGSDWFKWIVEQVKGCDIAFVLITPNSVQKPWIMWESGAVYGAAVATGDEELNKVRPLVYQLSSEEIPSPIRDSKTQYRYGDKEDDVNLLMRELVDSYKSTLSELSTDTLISVLSGLDRTVKTYLEEVDEALLNAPALPRGNVIEEWRHRLDQVVDSNRMSEIDQLNRWMDIAFGIEQDEPQALDLRIHARLGEIYLKALNTKKAISQFTLARRLAPRDIYVLRMLGKAYLDDRDLEEAEKVIKRIKELDLEASSKNAECAALEGRWYREKMLFGKAAEVYENALPANPDSHYLANLAAEAYLSAKNEDKAKIYFKQAVDIISRLEETNVWTLATTANASVALGDPEAALSALREISELGPTSGERETIRNGLLRIADSLDSKPDISNLLSALG
jgi:tetratricopeptide (TPR) repeat protein